MARPLGNNFVSSASILALIPRTPVKFSVISPLRVVCRLLAVIGLCAASAWAGQYPASGTQTFTFADGTTNLGDGSVIASSNGNATVVSNLL